jgi:hypothetical protein
MLRQWRRHSASGPCTLCEVFDVRNQGFDTICRQMPRELVHQSASGPRM